MRQKKLFKTIVLILVIVVTFAVPAFAAHHYTGNQYAYYGSGNVGVKSYIYYSSNTSSNINITSLASYVRNNIPQDIDYALFKVIEMPLFREYERSTPTGTVSNGQLKRVEHTVNQTFSKTTGTNGYVFIQTKVALGDTDASGIPSDGVYIGWDTFCYPSSFSSSFHS